MRRAGHNCAPPCDERARAQADGEFVFLASLGGWTFPAEPRRSPTASLMVRYAFGRVDHLPASRGVPYSWTCCPWCGGDLVPPSVEDEDGG